MREEQGTGEAMVKRSRNSGSNCRLQIARGAARIGDEQNIISAIVEGEQNRTEIDGGRAINRVKVVGGGAKNSGRSKD